MYTFLLCFVAFFHSGFVSAQQPSRTDQTYRALASTLRIENISGTVQLLSSHGSRVVGYPGERFAADYVAKMFDGLFGSQNVRTIPFKATVPVDEGASIAVGQSKFTLYSLWPNLVRTSQLPPSGLTGQLIDARAGRLVDYNGKNVEGSIVLIDFNSGTDWLNAPRLGAKAIIFVEPETTMRGQAEAKFISLPVNVPRYYIKRRDAFTLRQRIIKQPNLTGLLTARMHWKTVGARNFIGVIPGSSSNPEIAKQIIVVQASYDGMSVVPALAPAAEAATSTASLLELARVMRGQKNERTLWFVATSGHYLGLKGIRALVESQMNRWESAGPLAKLFGQNRPVLDPIHLWCSLDIASQSRAIGAFYKGYFVNIREDTQTLYSDIARFSREKNEVIATALGYDPLQRFVDGVNAVDGKTWRNHIPAKPAFDGEIVGMAGGIGLTFATVDDSRALCDTPFDVFERVNSANVVTQLKTFICLLHHYVNDSNNPQGNPKYQVPLWNPSPWTRMGLRSGFATLRGRVRDYDPKKSLVPSTPVPNSLALVPHVSGAKSFVGVRATLVERVSDGESGILGRDGDSTFAFVGMPPITADQQPHQISAYHLDDATGEIDFAPDKGVSGSNYPAEFTITAKDKEATVVLFPTVATTIFDLVDQQALKTLSVITILDGATNGEPRQFGYVVSKPEPGQTYAEDAAVIFARRGDEFAVAGDTAAISATNKLRQFKITMGSSQASTRFLLINATEKNPEGEGYVMGAGSGDTAINSSESTTITRTAYRVAKDMWALDEFRLQRLIRNNIRNEGVISLHQLAKEALERADQALKGRDYALFDAYSRAAWGYESRAYPDVTKTQQDVVNGVIFYLALLIPFSFFIERLFFGFADLKRQILGIFGVFITVFAVFAVIHPAFRITLNAGIILLAFIMLSLSVLVTVLVWQKFEQQIRAQNQETGGTHDKDATTGTIALAAFALGVANMRRRKARTTLTCVTLVLLTFTVLAFTSIVQDLRFNQVAAPGKPSYSGILVRYPSWAALQEVAYRLIDDEFSTKRLVAPRSWYLGTQQGEQTFLKLKRADKEFNAKGAAGLSVQEDGITHIASALTAGRWLVPTDTYAILLPTNIAAELRLDKRDVGTATVSFSGQDFLLVGLFDPVKLKRINDLDQEPLTPVDFVQMKQMQSQGKADDTSGFQQYVHLDAETVFFVPYQTLINMGGELRSIAIGYASDDGAVLKELRENLMRRLDMNLYAAAHGKIDRFSSVASTSGAGLETVVVPILIAALIVLNTMLGSVFERVKEIHIFSSIGLSPAHIGTLFMAEAMVYAIIGSVAGYVLGQTVSFMLAQFGWLQGISLNFSSVSAVLSTLLVVSVVMLSTLWPAKKASEVATPSIHRTWKLPAPEGDRWRIKLPFAVTGDQARGVSAYLVEWLKAYEGYSVGEIITEEVRPVVSSDNRGTSYGVACKNWLAPFDLGVSQQFELMVTPTELGDVFDVTVTLERVSGDVGNWQRVNRRFLNTIRKQFLIWRTLSVAQRQHYLTATVEVGATE